jgi:hypothetical protein
MTTMYIVTQGSYSDYHICAVFDTRERAEQFVALYGPDSDLDIEEYPLNPEVPTLPAGYTIWRVTMEWDGTTRSVCHADPGDVLDDIDIIPYIDQMRTTVAARTRQHAVKIANERRTQAIAAGQWPA